MVNDRRVAAALVFLFGLVAVLAGVDVAADFREGSSPRHLLIESAVLAVGLAGSVWMALRYRAMAVETRALAVHLAASREEAQQWKRDNLALVRGLSESIDRQLDRWALTPAEKEVALLLLKGLSHKEVGAARAVGEATVRQQAAAIYKKAGLGGRNDLAAFFLEDLLQPPLTLPPPAG